MKVDKWFLAARIAGEMKPADIPVAPGVNLDELKKDDNDPLEVVVEVPEGKSTRGWYYTGEALQKIVSKVNSNTLAGFLGHQEPEKVATEFPPPVTHWIGAKWENGKAYFRGVVDKVAPDLKRWIRSGRVRQVSIFGAPKLKTVNGETRVIGYNALSIDWTPLDRAGMPTRVVAVGEMDSTFGDGLDGEMDGSHEELRRALYQAAHAQFGGDGIYVNLDRVYDDFVIVSQEKNATRKMFQVPYTITGDSVTLGEPTEVELQVERKFVAVGEMEGDDVEMKIEEMLAAIRSAMAKGEMTLETVLGEIGYTPEQAVETLAGEQIKALQTAKEAGTKIVTALGLPKDLPVEEAASMAGEMAAVWKSLGFDKDKPEDVTTVAGEMANLYSEKAKESNQARLDKLVSSKVAGEMAQTLVKRMLHVSEDATDEQITGEIDNLLQDDAIKGLISGSYVDQSPGTGGSTGSQSSSKQNVRVKTVSL